MASPSSKQALAAQQRMQAKSRTNKSSSAQERKNRTAQLLFGDGLTIYSTIDSTTDEIRNSPKIQSSVVPSATKSVSSLVKNESQAANAAMKRLNMNQSKKLSTNERKARTMQLMHGDLLKNDEVSIPHERKADGYLDIANDLKDVHQSLLNLQNCNPHLKMPATAKLLRKILSNILQAESIEDQEKYGKIRLTQKKIKSAIVDMKYGVDILTDLGFVNKRIVNEKSGMMDEYMVYDFENANQKAIWHVMELLDEHYPENL